MKLIFKKIVVAILTFESRLAVSRHKPSVVAVTGSVGKTSTKDAVYAVLCEGARVRKSEKSFNSDIGVPLTILGRPNAWNNPVLWLQNLFDGALIALFNLSYPDWLVLEVGADRPGDIRSVARWLPIDIAIITRLPEVPVHVEFFESPEQLLEEKASLIGGLKPSGTLVLSADDARVASLKNRAGGARVITFGFSSEADVRGDAPESIFDEHDLPRGMRSRIYCGEESAEIALNGTAGAHTFLPMLAALAAAHSLDLPLAPAAAALERNYTPPQGRMRLVPGVRGSLIIDDTYNASPAALEAALQTLENISGAGRKIAVLGDMLELGAFSVTEHRKAGALCAQTTNLLLTVGIRARDIAEAALDTGMPEANILQFEDSEEAGAALAREIRAGDIALIKGSQSMRMERAVALAMAEPAQAHELLVRQEDAWSRK